MVEHRNDGSRETVFTMEATPLKFGPGCSEEIGWEVKQLRMSRVMLVSSPAKG
jgi:hydroxyacid-oxoacid transhydrogenase